MVNGFLNTDPEEQKPVEEDVRPAPMGQMFARQALLAAKHSVPVSKERYDPSPLDDEEEVRNYDPADVNALTLKTIAAKPENEGEPPALIRNSANFLLGDEMAIFGVKWDKDGLNFKVDTAVNQWSDHPVMSSIALAGIALPFVGALKKSAKVGKLAELGYTAYVGEAEHTARILGTGAKAGILEKTRTSSLLKYGDDWTRLADDMLHTVDEDAATLGSNKLKYFDDAFAAKVKEIPDPAKRLKALGGRKALQQRLLADDAIDRVKRLKLAVESGNANPLQQAQLALHERFANTFFNLGTKVNKQYINNMNKFWDNAKLSELFVHGLEKEDELPFFNYLHDKLNPSEFLKLSPSKQQYFARTRDRYWQHQAAALESGFISTETAAKVGKAHVAALLKNTNTSAITEVSGTTEFLEKGGIIRHYPKLTSPTLRERTKTIDEVITAAANGELITDVDTLHRTSIVKDEMLHVGYKLVRDVALKAGDSTASKYAIKAETFDGLTQAARKNWISLDELPGAGVSDRIRRMVAKAVGQDPAQVGRLPYLHQNVIDELFDSNKGMFSQMHNASQFMQVLTAIHKPSKTVFNLPSHFQNLMSNLLYFMPMAGVNPFKPSVVEDLQRTHKIVWEIAKDITEKSGNAASVMASRDALADIAKRAGVDTVFKTNIGTKIDLLDELTHPLVRQLIEDQAFENVEGFSSVADMYKRLQATPESNVFTKGLAKIYVDSVNAANKITKKTIGRPLLSNMSAAYLAEDMVPKLATYMQLRKRGLSIESAVLDIGRKFPQYKTVGKSIRGARKYAFPWLTFPAEATRVIKNNMMDSPLASVAWMQAPAMAQAATSGIGMAPVSPEEIQQAKEGAPFWASKPSTVVMNPQAQATTAGAFTGGTVGGVVGTLTAGNMGFMIGSAAGALVGGAVGYAGAKDEQDLRAWALDFLPQSAIMPKTDSPYVDARNAPSAAVAMNDAMKIIPLEPLSVLMPVVRMTLGEDEFGNDIPAEGLSDSLMKMAAGTFGILAPPWVQKYGLRVGTPNAGVFGLDKLSTATLAGAAAGLAGYGLYGPMGAAAGVLGGGALGTQIDTSKFEEDIGMRANPKTGERGNPVFDVLFNSVTGLGKSWKATPGQRAFNQKLREDNLQKYRTVVRKKMADAAMNGDEDKLNDLVQDYFISYSQQYDNPRDAQAKFSASMENLIPALRRNPQYKRFTEEELRSKLRDSAAFAIKHRGEFMDRSVEDIRRELLSREVGRHKSGDAIGYDLNFDFKAVRPKLEKGLLIR